jgi:two-component system OmpR family response regulator
VPIWGLEPLVAKVLVVEDDLEISSAIVASLSAAGFETEQCFDGEEALKRASQKQFDAITLDRLLPRLEGLEMLKRLRSAGVQTPVLMLSSLSELSDRIEGLRNGGDDYLVKPYEPSELVVRLEVLMRRRQRSPTPQLNLRVGDLELDLINREARRNGLPIELLPTEFKLLEFMMRNPDRMLSRRLIFERVWGYHFDPGTNLIDVHIGKLRKKIDLPGLPSMFRAERGTGYELHAA